MNISGIVMTRAFMTTVGLALGLALGSWCFGCSAQVDPLSPTGVSQPGSGGAAGPGSGDGQSGGAGPAGGTGNSGSGGADTAGTGGAASGGRGVSGATGGAGSSRSGGASVGTGSGGATATGGVSGGTGGAPASGSGGAVVPGGSVAMFVAGGYRGRTTISCDDGATWVANHSDDDSVCPNHDCGEVFNTITGVTFGGGYFFISRGWGQPGNVLRSQDGVNWTQIYSGKQFGGVAFGGDTLVIGSGWQAAYYSANAAAATPAITGAQDISGLLGGSTGTIRNVSYQSFGGGRFILIPDDGAGMRKIAVSRDLGRTYTLGTMANDMCASRITDVVSGGDIIVGISDETGWACRSIDGGATWTGKQISTDGLSRQLIWNGSQFLAYGGGSGYRSADGDTWTKFTLSPANLRFGAMARSGVTGTIVASTPYGTDYTAQKFYRSGDGVTWQTLAAGTFVGSHLIEHMSFGVGLHSTACP